MTKTVGVVLFEGFELLDVFGPAEAYSSPALDGALRVVMVAERAGAIISAQGPKAVADYAFAEDFHEITTFLALGAITGGEVTVKNANPEQFPLIDRAFVSMMASLEEKFGEQPA